MRLATFKHISSKNADYGAAEKYLLFEHDEFMSEPVLGDMSGRLHAKPSLPQPEQLMDNNRLHGKHYYQ